MLRAPGPDLHRGPLHTQRSYLPGARRSPSPNTFEESSHRPRTEEQEALLFHRSYRFAEIPAVVVPQWQEERGFFLVLSTVGFSSFYIL
jgi:hypothetical protein